MSKLWFPLMLMLLFSNCKNELEINADWVETPVVYGFIDAFKDTQYIRIQKTYQNSVTQSTKEAAQYTDSLYFDSTFEVKVVTNYGEEMVFTRTELPKSAGFFEYGKHYVYMCPNFKPGLTGVQSRQYYLIMRNPVSGKTYKSNPAVLVDSARFGSSGNIVNITTPDLQGNIGAVTFRINQFGTNARIYDLIIRMNYDEYYTDGSMSSKYVDYYVQHNWQLESGLTSFSTSIKGKVYMQYLKDNVHFDAGVSYRKFRNVTYYASGGTAELAYVTDLSQPSTTIVPKSTQYTNITGALGLFSSISVNTIRPLVPGSSVLKSTIDSELPQFTP